jgi:hypothetical protein
MRRFLQRLKFAWEYFAKGQHRLPPLQTPPDFSYPEPDAGLMNFLAGMFQAHGAYAVRAGNWVVVDGGRLYARAAHFDHKQHPNNLVLQVDFIIVLSSGEHIAEAFAGVGVDIPSALRDACQSFQDSSFHALFTALLGRPCDHVEREEWVIGGAPRRITIGLLRMRGQLPLDQWPPVYAGIRKQIESFPISSGLHWIRVFYANFPADNPTVEVLLDNASCSELQTQIGTLPWPRADTFYSARLFLVIQDV